METMYPGKVNSPATTLDGGINNVVTTIDIINGSVLPSAPNIAVIGTGEDAETILYATKIGNQLSNITRGFQGAAKAWLTGAIVARTFTEYDHAKFKQNIETLESEKGEVNTASNIGTGTGIFKQKTGVDLEFRKLVAEDNKILVSNVPAGSPIQIEKNTTQNDFFNFSEPTWRGQTFLTTSAHTITSIKLKLYRILLPGIVTVSIRATSEGLPIGEDLTSGTTNGDTLTLSNAGEIREITVDPINLDDATVYAIVFRALTSDSSNRIGFRAATTDVYVDGQAVTSLNSGVEWSAYGTRDLYFEIWGIAGGEEDQIKIGVNEENIRGGLLSITIIAFNADADTTLYTVPTGKRCVLSHAIVVAAGDAGATTTISIGQNTAETDFVPANTLSNLDAEYDVVILMPIPNTTPLKIKSYPAETVIEAQVASQSGVAGNTVYLFGILY